MKSKTLKDLQKLENKVALVVGGSGFLGKAICETLAELGATVIIASRNEIKCNEVAELINQQFPSKCYGMGLDILNNNEIKILLETIDTKFKRLDILINNAWSGKKNSFESISFEDWNYDIDMCLNSVFSTIKLSVPYLKKTKGLIINTSSMYGHVAPDYKIYDGNKFANPPSYGAAKAGVIQLSKYLASFLSPHKIRVNSVSPGPFPFPETLKNEKFINELCSRNMLNRVGVPDDLKGVYALLASDASKYITGQNFCVDGGWTSW
jgi:NAD(P)-dependent dehydrogenase (short-subunit alcohol dehydrogenase family)